MFSFAKLQSLNHFLHFLFLSQVLLCSLKTDYLLFYTKKQTAVRTLERKIGVHFLWSFFYTTVSALLSFQADSTNRKVMFVCEHSWKWRSSLTYNVFLCFFSFFYSAPWISCFPSFSTRLQSLSMRNFEALFVTQPHDSCSVNYILLFTHLGSSLEEMM